MNTPKCSNVKECICPNVSCGNYGKCCDCVANHRAMEAPHNLPACLRPKKED
ncbi:MAG: hypothetical protein LBU36_05805 [Clostridiales bacterium]|jgi:hypothetical protein|nr:hypothetical protein [Clostridiales bacterium]